MLPWPLQESGMLCYSAPYLYVSSREECQSFAQELGHEFYAHRSDLQPERCITFDDCSAPAYSTSFWKLYTKPVHGSSQEVDAVNAIDGDGICVDTWLPEWTEDATKACESWARDRKWGALRAGRSLKKACESFWAQLNCAKTCGCPADTASSGDKIEEIPDTSVTKVVMSVEACKDRWLPDWATNSSHACSAWAQASWGALRDGSLAEACRSNWAQESCAKTCGCPQTHKASTPPSGMSASDGLKRGDEDARKLAAEMAQ